MKDALVRYAKWLRRRYEFPVRVPVYLFPGNYIITSDGDKVAASFFAPYSRDVEPYIRIATGGYSELLENSSRDDALAAYITSFSHEIVHYFQWIKTGDVHERGVAQRALKMLEEYAENVEAP